MMVKWTYRKGTAVAIFLVYLVVILGVLLLAPEMVPTSIDVLNSGHSRTFQIPTFFKFNSTDFFGPSNESDVIICMNFTYPHGTLIVNDPVVINATAIIKGNMILTVGEIYVGFPNCLAFPNSYDEDGLPRSGLLYFSNILYENRNANVTFVVEPDTIFYITSNTQLIWTIDGDYVPIIHVHLFDGKESTFVPEDVVLHAYPQEQLAQIQTNKISVAVTLALFIFSTVGVATLFFDLWDSDKNICKYEKPTETKTAQPKKKQNHPHNPNAENKGNKT